jgi:abequosyltransferase
MLGSTTPPAAEAGGDTAQPLLSICIATLNRAAFIGETLESILSQCTDQVEVVIVDGASTDGTDAIVRELQKQWPNLRYCRLSKNGGVDQDYCATVQMATGRYCWLMSDDDVLKDGAIAAVLAAVRNDYELIIVNAEVRNFDLSRVVEQRRLPFSADRMYAPEDMDKLFIDIGDYLTFIGCVVIKRSVWLERKREPYFGSNFIHIGVIFQCAMRTPVLVIATPYIAIRYGNATWMPREFEIWMHKWPSLVNSLTGLSESARQRSHFGVWRLTSLLFFRAKGSYSIREYRRWLSPAALPRNKKLAARLIALLPGPVVNALGVFYYSSIYRRSPLPLMDMRQSRYHPRNWFKA